MSNRLLLYSFSLLFLTSTLTAQIGGKSTYDFLSLSPAARLSSLGGVNVSTIDADPSFQLANPASLNEKQHKEVSFSTVAYPGKINFGNASYVYQFKHKITGGFGIQYIAFGEMKETDNAGNILGKFNAGGMAIYGGAAYHFGKLFSVGANAKFIYSQLASYNSGGMAIDLAAALNDTAHRVTFSIVAKNIGGQFKTYLPGMHESIPFDLQAGVSFQLAKTLPLRFHVNLHHLQVWDIRYNNPADAINTNLFASDTTNNKPSRHVGDKLFRHVVIGAEFTIKKVVRLNIAYNHLVRSELQLSTKRSAAGLSFGFGIHAKQVDFSYAVAPMVAGTTLHHFTLTLNTAGFIRRKS